MKEPLKAPFILLFILLCSTVVLAVLDLLYTWGMYDSASRGFSLTYAAQRFPRSLFEVLIPSVMLSIVLMGFRMARKPFSRLLGLIIVLGVSYLALVNGMLWLRVLGAKTQAASGAPLPYVQPSTFLRVGDTVISADVVKGTSLREVLLFDTTKTASRFSVAAAATASAQAGTLSVTTAGRPAVSVSGSPALAWTGVFAPDRFTALFLRDINTLVTDFERLLDRSLGEFFAACFSLLLLCTASLALLRLTRWPLANIMLLVIAVRGYFFLYHLLATELTPRIAAAVTDQLAARMLPSAAFAALGVLFLLLDVLLIPADRWIREEAA